MVRARRKAVADDRIRAPSSAVTLRYPFNALVSYHYYRNADIAALASGGLRLVADSGAYSARTLGAAISVDEFADWTKQWRAHLCWVASLDVIREPDVTWANYRRLRDRHGLDVIPTLHAGDDAIPWIDRYAADGVDFIGLGGLTPHRGSPKKTIPWLVNLMRHARDKYPTMRFHGWGCTNQILTKVLPWYSVDSSNLGQSYRYGRLNLFNPHTATWTAIHLNGHEPLKYSDLLQRVYGVSPRDVLRSVPENRPTLVRLSAKSYQFVEDYLRRRHGVVPAPLYGVTEPVTTGPNVHAALDTHRRASDVLTELGHPGPHVHGTTAYGHTGDDDWNLSNPDTRPGPNVHGTTGIWVDLNMATRDGGDHRRAVLTGPNVHGTDGNAVNLACTARTIEGTGP